VAHKMAVHTDPSADKKAAAKPDASFHKVLSHTATHCNTLTIQSVN